MRCAIWITLRQTSGEPLPPTIRDEALHHLRPATDCTLAEPAGWVTLPHKPIGWRLFAEVRSASAVSALVADLIAILPAGVEVAWIPAI